MQKMGESKGRMVHLDSGKNVYFIPEAVLYYGFAHLPSQSDPEGRLFERLPQPPRKVHLEHGTYVVMSDPTTRKPQGLRGSQDPQLREAKEVYSSCGSSGLDPQTVIEALVMAHVLEKVWFEVDLERDLKKQFASLSRWLEGLRREIYRRPGQKTYRRREAARDTLIYTLKSSKQLSARDIAKQVFSREFSTETSRSLEERVRQSLRRTRKALKAAGYNSSPSRA